MHFKMTCCVANSIRNALSLSLSPSQDQLEALKAFQLEVLAAQPQMEAAEAANQVSTPSQTRCCVHGCDPRPLFLSHRKCRLP